MKNDLYISWEEYHKKIEDLAMLINRSGWHFDQILCLARGGLRVGDTLSRLFGVPLAILSTSSYIEKEQNILTIAEHVTMCSETLRGNILLVDDLVDSGVTLNKVLDYLSERFPDIKEIKTAVIWFKSCSIVNPDFSLDYIPEDLWIHQPFEE
jgi:hypoxanthine phosphoribosyltransferase